MARPRIEIKQKEFEALCKLQCTEDEICSVLGVCSDTLNSWCKRTYKAGFSEVFKQKRAGGHVSLRRFQFQLAEKNAAMAIFLGKNYLGQKDNPPDIHEDDLLAELDRRLFGEGAANG